MVKILTEQVPRQTLSSIQRYFLRWMALLAVKSYFQYIFWYVSADNTKYLDL